MLTNSKLVFVVFLVGLTLCTSCNSVKHNEQSKAQFVDAPDLFNRRAMVGPQDDGTHVVATSQIINPAGNTVVFPGRPTDLALNNAETILAVKNKSDLTLFDVDSQTIKQTLKLPKGGNTFVGIAWSSNDSIVWTTDTSGFLRSAIMGENGFS